MPKDTIEFRFVDRNCYCRSCNKDVDRNIEKLISFRSVARKGGVDFICSDCVKKMYELIK